MNRTHAILFNKMGIFVEVAGSVTVIGIVLSVRISGIKEARCANARSKSYLGTKKPVSNYRNPESQVGRT
jgi:hypothetical protein